MINLKWFGKKVVMSKSKTRLRLKVLSARECINQIKYYNKNDLIGQINQTHKSKVKISQKILNLPWTQLLRSKQLKDVKFELIETKKYHKQK